MCTAKLFRLMAAEKNTSTNKAQPKLIIDDRDFLVCGAFYRFISFNIIQDNELGVLYNMYPCSDCA